jgi:hypothetical protein
MLKSKNMFATAVKVDLKSTSLEYQILISAHGGYK